MSEIVHPIGSWEIIKLSGGHGVYEKGWGFVAIHDTSCHAHWNAGQAVRRALIAAAPAMREYIESSAMAGCAEAIKIMETINGNS